MQYPSDSLPTKHCIRTMNDKLILCSKGLELKSLVAVCVAVHDRITTCHIFSAIFLTQQLHHTSPPLLEMCICSFEDGFKKRFSFVYATFTDSFVFMMMLVKWVQRFGISFTCS